MFITKASSNSNQIAVTPADKQATKIINQTTTPVNVTATSQGTAAKQPAVPSAAKQPTPTPPSN